MGATNPNTLGSVLPGSGTSFSVQTPDINQNLTQMTQVTLTPAQVITAFTTPLVLLPAPGAGKSIVVDYILYRLTYAGTAYTLGGVVTVGYAGGAAVVNTMTAALITASASADTLLVTGSTNITATQNAAIQLSVATQNFATGNSNLVLFIYYSIV